MTETEPFADARKTESSVLYPYYSAPMILPFNSATFGIRHRDYPCLSTGCRPVWCGREIVADAWQNNGGRMMNLKLPSWSNPKHTIQNRFNENREFCLISLLFCPHDSAIHFCNVRNSISWLSMLIHWMQASLVWPRNRCRWSFIWAFPSFSAVRVEIVSSPIRQTSWLPSTASPS